MERGGRRDGAGRKKGSVNKDRSDFVQALREAGSVDELIEKMRELAQGVIVADLSKPGRPVYAKAPDAYAIAYLLDQAFGKAKQHVEVDTGAGYEQFFVGIEKAYLSDHEKRPLARLEYQAVGRLLRGTLLKQESHAIERGDS